MCSPRATQLITTNRPQFAVMNKSICQDRLRTQQEVNAGMGGSSGSGVLFSNFSYVCP
eukprot:COSAG06_NODE_44751_length_361_cov_0.431298_1_plen_57_part_01